MLYATSKQLNGQKGSKPMAQLLPVTEEHMQLSIPDLLSLRDAKVPAGAFAMRSLDEGHVEQLVESDQDEWPPILVTCCVEGYIVIDGYHRWEAAKAKQSFRISATCQAYADEHAVIEAAFRANLSHGLKANIQTRGDYAYWLHVTFPDLPQEEIARRANMSQGAVSKAITLRDKASARALKERGYETPVDPKVQRKAAKRACHHFAKFAIRFLAEVDVLSDEELSDLLLGSLKTPEERLKLTRIHRALAALEVETVPAPQRLRQFAPMGDSQRGD